MNLVVLKLFSMEICTCNFLLNMNTNSKFFVLKGKVRTRNPYKFICNNQCENFGNFEGYPLEKGPVKAAVYEGMSGRESVESLKRNCTFLDVANIPGNPTC